MKLPKFNYSSGYMRFLPGLLISLVALVSNAKDGKQSFRDKCLSFRPEKYVPQAKLTQLEYLPSETTLNLADNDPSCNRSSQAITADVCRIALQIRTSGRSEISFELWMPSYWKDDRYLATGNGGIDGCIKYEDLAYGTANGFATMGTNNGHNGTTAVKMYRNPDVVVDFSYRALHVGTKSAKKLVDKFYGREARRSYYLGCSLGGRMGIKAAERFPDDYDGIVAGCPAVDFNNLNSERAMFYPITGSVNSSNFISVEKWQGLIHKEVLKQCDEIDGVKDGIIEVASRCRFDPSTLLCRGDEEDPNNCLNANQVDQLNKIYADYRYSNGELIFPRMNPGNEMKVVERLIAGKPFAYSEEWFKYVVLNDPSWNPITFSEQDAKQAEQLNPADIKTWPKSLPDFRRRGGKIISYHGGQDNQITSFNTERFWDHMYEADGQLDEYFRFFRISGMFHCNGGPGAWAFGQGGGAPAEGIPFQGSQNVLAAIVEWVESGKAPKTLTGTKFVGDNISQGIDFQRYHCPYPRSQMFIGGDHKNPASWRCKSDCD